MLKNFTVIEVISSKTKAQLSFYPNKFKFNQFTAPDLENPPYVQFLIDTTAKILPSAFVKKQTRMLSLLLNANRAQNPILYHSPALSRQK